MKTLSGMALSARCFVSGKRARHSYHDGERYPMERYRELFVELVLLFFARET